MKGEERKKRKIFQEIPINHNVWKKYHKGYVGSAYMKHIATYLIIRKKIVMS